MKAILFIIFLFSSQVYAQMCSLELHSKAHDQCEAETSLFHPTQFTVGFYSMKEKRKKIEKKYLASELKAYLADKIVPAFWGPDSRLHLIDRHHTTLALQTAEIPAAVKIIPVKIMGNYSKMSFQKFYEALEAAHNVYLSKHGNLLPASELPEALEELVDDPYRSLAAMVRENGGFTKQDIPFLEFMWADFFRKEIKLKSGEKKDLYRVLKRATRLAKSKKAKHLPGYIKNSRRRLFPLFNH